MYNNIMQEDYVLLNPVYSLKDGTDEQKIEDSDLTEVYCVAYKVKSRIPGNGDQEYYTFTLDFEQAYKRFKILPYGRAVLTRILTNKDELIESARKGTAPKYKDTDLDEGILKMLDNLKFSDIYGDLTTCN